LYVAFAVRLAEAFACGAAGGGLGAGCEGGVAFLPGIVGGLGRVGSDGPDELLLGGADGGV